MMMAEPTPTSTFQVTTTQPVPAGCLAGSLKCYLEQQGSALEDRVEPFASWMRSRSHHGVWPYGRTMTSMVGEHVEVVERAAACRYLNFGSQDYLGLAQDTRVFAAAREAIDRYGVHSAGSPAFIGRTGVLTRVETRIAEALGKEACCLFPTGWAAGFGVIAGLVRRDDIVVMDALAHNCLQTGAAQGGNRVMRFAHNDLCDLECKLAAARAGQPGSGIFVVVESLYSMDSDSPDLGALVRLSRRFGAIVIVDVAHDFGAMGARGLGLLEEIDGRDRPDVIMGSFSKTFAANGGFVACSRRVKEYLSYYAGPLLFSNAMSPIQSSVVDQCLDIVFSQEGRVLRTRLLDNALMLRDAMVAEGCGVAGSPSPIVPVMAGDEATARLTARRITVRGLLANLVEFPAVARGKARFRFQIMSTNSPAAIAEAARIFGQASREANEERRVIGS